MKPILVTSVIVLLGYASAVLSAPADPWSISFVWYANMSWGSTSMLVGYYCMRGMSERQQQWCVIATAGLSAIGAVLFVSAMYRFVE